MTAQEALRRIVEVEESRRERRALAEQQGVPLERGWVRETADRIDDRRWE